MDQTSVISLDTIKFLTSDGLKLFTNNILSIIEDNEYVTATAITDLNDRLLIVENNNSGSIITEADITAWGFTKNTGTITGISANGTSVATSGVANIPAASTSAYGVTKLSDATNSTSTTLAATANAVKKAYDLANSYKGTITAVQANGTSIATSGTANIPAATTSKYGVTKLSDATNSTSITLAATANAVKQAYDLANSYKGTVTSIKLNHMTYTPTDGLIEAKVAQMVTLNGTTIIPNTVGAIPLGNLATEDALNNVLTIIEDNEYVTATAITDLNERITNLELNGGGGSSGANVQAVDTGDVIDDVTVDYATKAYVDGLIGDINSILESIINGGGNVSIFPITLTLSVNGQSAIDLFNYVVQNHANGSYYFKENEIVKYDSTIIPYFDYPGGDIIIYPFDDGITLMVKQSGMVILDAGAGD